MRTKKYIAALGLSMLLAVLLPGGTRLSPVLANEPTATTTPDLPPLTLTVSGTVISGTAGASISPGLPLLLHVAHPDSGAQTDVVRHQAILDADSTFRFENIRALPGDLIFVSAGYGGVQQSSSIIKLSAEQQKIDLPLILYAPTTDPGAVSLVRAQYILDIKSGGLMQVLASHFYRNSSDHFYISQENAAGGQPVSVNIPLPIGAVGIAFDTVQRFLIGGSTMAPIVQDTRPVQPGQLHEIVFSYQLPYQGGASIDQDYPYGAQAVEILMPGDAGLSLTDGSKIVSKAASYPASFDKSQDTQINPQRPYTRYTLQTPLKAGERLIYTLEGGVSATPVSDTGRASSNTVGVGAFLLLVLLLLGAVVVSTLGVRRFFMRRIHKR